MVGEIVNVADELCVTVGVFVEEDVGVNDSESVPEKVCVGVIV